MVLNFIRKKLPKITSQNDLQKALLLLAKDSYEQKALKYFDFISWLDSKNENRPLAEIVKEKAHATIT